MYTVCFCTKIIDYKRYAQKIFYGHGPPVYTPVKRKPGSEFISFGFYLGFLDKFMSIGRNI